MIALVENKKAEIAELCHKFGVRKLDVFGSAVNGKFNEATSDIDFVVDFADKSPGYARRYIGLADALELLFGRPVDLLTEGSIKNPLLRESIDEAREVVFHDEGNRQAAA